MNENPWKDDPPLALSIVRGGLDKLKGGAVKFKMIGDFCVLSPEEEDALNAFEERMTAYAALAKPKRPLCWGVFGPPGSGKSFAVEELLKTLPPTSPFYLVKALNLSQLLGLTDLSAALAKMKKAAGPPGKHIPVVFFDEFDSRLAGSPLGWLQWLLAPMQDGVVLHNGVRIELKRAVFVFAGGTANTFEEFPRAHEAQFRHAKGPDFLSRLRGHMNVLGPNSWPYRRVRRAIILRQALERVAEGLFEDEQRRAAKKKIKAKSIKDPEVKDEMMKTAMRAEKIKPDAMTDTFIEQLLAVGRYRHGARSVEALVEMSTAPLETKFEKIADPKLRANHVDLGPLGDRVITLSAGNVDETATADLERIWTNVATHLLEHGAGLVYGGDLRRGGFSESLIKANEALPEPLGSESAPEKAGANPPVPTILEKVPDNDFLRRPRCGRVTWVEMPKKSQGDVPKLPRVVDYKKLECLSVEELGELKLPAGAFDRNANPFEESIKSKYDGERLGKALAMFRMRALVTRFADAHLVFGGKQFGWSGRFPGIAEEVMLSLAAGIPVYVCGGFGGAAKAVGEVLGLGEPWASAPQCLQRDAHGTGAGTLESAVKTWRYRFQLPHRKDLPLDFDELVEFLRAHALGGPRWPDNGLNPEDNRTLFRSRDAMEIVELVMRGLDRRAAVLENSQRGSAPQ